MNMQKFDASQQRPPDSVETPRPGLIVHHPCSYPAADASSPRRILGGGVQRYCSSKCRRADWERRHPRTTLTEIEAAAHRIAERKHAASTA